MIIQTGAFLKGCREVCNGVKISRQWSEEERTMHINLLEPLAITILLHQRKRLKVIHFHMDNKAALSYLLKMGENKEEAYNQIKLKDLALSSQSQYIRHSRIPASIIKYSSRQGIKEKTRLFRMAFSFQSFPRGFSTTTFFDNRSICFLPMPLTSSIYSLIITLGDGCNKTKLEHWSSVCISPIQYDFKSASNIKIGMCSSPDLLILNAPVWST